jgi:hypothetical protein
MPDEPQTPTPEGAITFWCQHQHADWPTNEQDYNFGEVSGGGVTATAVKHTDRTIAVSLSGPQGRTIEFRQPIPPCDQRGLFIAINWTPLAATLYLNGKQAETRSLGN